MIIWDVKFRRSWVALGEQHGRSFRVIWVGIKRKLFRIIVTGLNTAPNCPLDHKVLRIYVIILLSLSCSFPGRSDVDFSLMHKWRHNPFDYLHYEEKISICNNCVRILQLFRHEGNTYSRDDCSLAAAFGCTWLPTRPEYCSVAGRNSAGDSSSLQWWMPMT